ncbi:vinculin-like isoform X8, partial [Leptotrombidium deliense]
AKAWLSNPSFDDKGLGEQAINSIIEEGRRIANISPAAHRQDILNLCNDCESLNKQLGDLCRRGQGNSPQAHEIAKTLSQKLDELKKHIENALVNRVVDDFVDVLTPLKQFTEATLAPEGTPNREANFQDKAHGLQNFSQRAAQTARNVASGSAGNKKLAENLMSSANQVESLSPQLVHAGRIRFTHPENKAADEHFENLRKQYGDSIQKMRKLVDDAIDTGAFIKATEDAIRKHTGMCEYAIQHRQPQSMVDNTSAIARLANRVLMVAKQEADNSEDPQFIAREAKAVALNINDPKAQSRWRDANNAVNIIFVIYEVHCQLINAVVGVRKAITPETAPDIGSLSLNAAAPPRPPLPHGDEVPPRPPPPAETDDEYEDRFPTLQRNEPIMMAAHGLHQEVKQWSSKDNEIIAAAKKMALLMAKLSQLVRGEGGTKKDLIACAKAIADASEEVTRLAKEQAKLCTDKRMRTNILQVCERIPTIGTQLRILSTVKATMLGAQGTEEDQEATDMLVGNAQNLMQSVKETVRACEAASIKIRTDAGVRCIWTRKQPWYQY